jgi:polysaccharide biosynthesis protein PslH
MSADAHYTAAVRGSARSEARGSETLPRVLVLAESLPWPTLKGGDLRTWQNINALAGRMLVGVFGLCSNDTRRNRPPDLPLAFWTTSTDPALTSPPPTGTLLAARAWLLDPAGHPSDLFHSAVAEAEIAGVIARFQPDLVLVEGLWLHGYLRMIRAAGGTVIFDCHNIEAAVFAELARSCDRQDLEGRVMRDVIPARTEAIEHAAVHAVDQIWVCSADDEVRLHDRYRPRAPVFVVPNGIRIDGYAATLAARGRSGDGAPPTLVYPGIFAYLPNAFAAAFLVDRIMPRLNASDEARDEPFTLLLIGPMPTQEMLAAAARDPHIVVTGPVPDIRPFLAAATAMPVPLFHGGGTRLKVLEAFASGLPVVSTAKGVEGLGARHGTHLLVAETDEDFVTALLTLHRDGVLARRLADHARNHVAEGFSWQAAAQRIGQAIDQLLGRGTEA